MNAVIGTNRLFVLLLSFLFKLPAIETGKVRQTYLASSSPDKLRGRSSPIARVNERASGSPPPPFPSLSCLKTHTLSGAPKFLPTRSEGEKWKLTCLVLFIYERVKLPHDEVY